MSTTESPAAGTGPVGTGGSSVGTGVPKPEKQPTRVRPYTVLFQRPGSTVWAELTKEFTAPTTDAALEQAGDFLNATSDLPDGILMVAVASKNWNPKPVGTEVVEKIKIG